MKYCEHCGGKLENGAQYCPNCGAKVDTKEKKEVVNATVVNNDGTTTVVKDNTTLGFVLSLIGALCCTYIAIPGLIISIQSLQQMKEGKISSEKKWMAIVGIVLSAIGIFQMIWNLTHLNESSQRVQDIIDKFNK